LDSPDDQLCACCRRLNPLWVGAWFGRPQNLIPDSIPVLIPFGSGLGLDAPKPTPVPRNCLNPLWVGAWFGPKSKAKRESEKRLNPLWVGAWFGPSYEESPHMRALS